MGEVIERKNITAEEVKEVIKVFPVEFFGNRVVVTVNSDESEGLSVQDNVLSERQYVIAAGTIAREVKAGDEVLLDLPKLMVKKTLAHDAYQTEEVLDLKPFVFGEYTFAIINDNQLQGRVKNV